MRTEENSAEPGMRTGSGHPGNGRSIGLCTAPGPSSGFSPPGIPGRSTRRSSLRGWGWHRNTPHTESGQDSRDTIRFQVQEHRSWGDLRLPMRSRPRIPGSRYPLCTGVSSDCLPENERTIPRCTAGPQCRTPPWEAGRFRRGTPRETGRFRTLLHSRRGRSSFPDSREHKGSPGCTTRAPRGYPCQSRSSRRDMDCLRNRADCRAFRQGC